ncbi:Gfo/Idh/MocA family oxidoreductase [Pseudomonas sp. Rh2]|uniref:Gfo/Idh/MocA family protein n=1 Tax=unclassified Pseudomonas TaxID=196821 RepID=UPI00345DF09F
MRAPKKYLVIGSGSIARRHIANIKSLYDDARVFCISASGRAVSAEEVGADAVYTDIEQAITAKPDLAVVASPAPFHAEQAATLLKAGIPTLVEKPLSDSLGALSTFKGVLEANKDKIEVAYNLRYMPSAIKLKELLGDSILGRVLRVTIDVGQYLPDWRPSTDYRLNVSAQKRLGGGVILELSHELDYLIWFFGSFDSAYCVTSNSGILEVDVEDGAYAILSREDGLVAIIQMDFLQRKPARTCKIVGELGTLIWDVMCNSIVLRGASGEEQVLFSGPDYDRNTMYLDEISHFSKVADGLLSPAVDIYQAMSVMELVEALKNSSSSRKVVKVGGEHP